jgi:predicted NAD/FAD-binding protein
MLYSESERAWLDRRAVEVAERTGWPEPIARSEAAAEMVRMRQRPACKVLEFAKRAGKGKSVLAIVRKEIG